MGLAGGADCALMSATGCRRVAQYPATLHSDVINAKRASSRVSCIPQSASARPPAQCFDGRAVGAARQAFDAGDWSRDSSSATNCLTQCTTPWKTNKEALRRHS